MVSAVPAGEVMARDEVLGIGRPWAATIGTMIMRGAVAGNAADAMLVHHQLVAPAEPRAHRRHGTGQAQHLGGRGIPRRRR